MKTITTSLSLALISSLALAQDTKMDPVSVEGQAVSDSLELSQSLKRKGDISGLLSTQFADVNAKRASGTSGDIFIRGLGYENITVLHDGNKLYGGCPNHMDPPAAHAAASSVERIEIIRGPYDVKTMGSMGGRVDIITDKKIEGSHGSLSLEGGSFDSRKGTALLEAGNEEGQIRLGAEHNSMGVYEDGDGNPVTDVRANYKSGIDNETLYQKRDYWFSAKKKIGHSSTVYLDAGGGTTDVALFPGKAMDEVDTSRLKGSVGLGVEGLGSFSDHLKVSVYANEVEHLMDNYTYRNVPDGMMPMANDTESSMKGIKIINLTGLGEAALESGLEFSRRTWDSEMENKMSGMKYRMLDTEVRDIGAYLDYERSMGDWKIFSGIRLDVTTSENNARVTQAKITALHGDYDSEQDETLVGGYVRAEYEFLPSHVLYGGIGRSLRLPDPTELFAQKIGKGTDASPHWVGNPNLDPTSNHEIDLGVRADYGAFDFRIEGFYSKLDNYIYASKQTDADGAVYKSYENIDATIYGVSVGGGYEVTPDFRAELLAAFQKGSKDDQPSRNGDDDLAEIPPAKLIGRLHYGWGQLDSTLEAIVASEQSDIDSDAGEQEIDGYTVVNVSAKYTFGNHSQLYAGIDNLFDEQYAVANSYDKDPINPSSAIVYEPGRFFYAGVSFGF